MIYLNRTPEDAYRPLVGGTNPPLLAFRCVQHSYPGVDSQDLRARSRTVRVYSAWTTGFDLLGEEVKGVNNEYTSQGDMGGLTGTYTS